MSKKLKTIRKIVVANRGEIAIRVIRACRELGIESVAVFSDVDRSAAHVRLADEAYCIGQAPSAKSYLLADNILKVALESGADAVHPGYGFLSENADFARRVAEQGFIFIGPSPEAIELMGNKTRARKVAIDAKIPVVPGTTGIADIEAALTEAHNIGYPILIKAAAGGGGKGMRVVDKKEELSNALDRAKGEALSAFGDDTVFIEKYVTKPRHVEIQILGDEHGNTISLGERECSIQRRHQKVIEESPCSIMTDDLRSKMGAAAVQLAKACKYYNAGTVEFLLDDKMNFYFLEVNTRLQVEHPVTEMVTGIDLVKKQIAIAEGHELGLKQADIVMNGHAIECRIYAEDSENDFAPSVGIIKHLEPSYGPGIREDSGIFQGDTIQVYYDPMISKLVAWGQDRTEAIARMHRALREYAIVGVDTTIPFCLFVMNNEEFQKGDFDTSFVSKHFSPEQLEYKEEKIAAIAAAIFDFKRSQDLSVNPQITPSDEKLSSKWKLAGRTGRP